MRERKGNKEGRGRGTVSETEEGEEGRGEEGEQ